MPLEFLSRSESQTAALAAGIARLLDPGSVVVLEGDLGTGKTFFVRSAAEALGVSDPVTSPSFTMAQTYEGKAVRIHHLDLYRLATFTPDDAIDFEPFFEDEAITFIEWPESAQSFIGEPALVLRLEHVDPTTRRIKIDTGNDGLSKELEQMLDGLGD